MKYNQVIEVEYIDKLISHGDSTSLASLVMLCRELNQDEFFQDNFFFEVIKYGFQGYYAAVGVVYLKEDIDYNRVSEDLVEQIDQYFLSLIEKRSVKYFIDFMIENKEEIESLDNEINNT